MDHLLDDLRFGGVAGQRLSKRDKRRLDIQKFCHLLNLGYRQLPLAGNQFGDETRRHALRESWIVSRSSGVFRDGIVRHNQYQETVIEWCPAQNAVLSKRPVIVQTALEMYQIAPLAKAHFAGKTRQLIQVRRIIGYSPNTGLRKIVKVHSVLFQAWTTPKRMITNSVGVV
jgi:hypothetical protein